MTDCILAIPNAGNVSAGVIGSVMNASAVRKVALQVGRPCSILTHAFNLSWCDALNMKPRPKFFAMHHADISAETGWLDKLIEELERVDCDVLSAVVPIKDMRGLTSTMILDVENASYRRITMRELAPHCETCSAAIPSDRTHCSACDEAGAPCTAIPPLPVSFRAPEVPWAPERGILGINTGLWVCKLDAWAESICFHNTERNKRNAETGDMVPIVMPEDWNFGIDLHMKGLSVYATRAAKLRHFGTFGFPSDETFGTETEDTWHQL